MLEKGANTLGKLLCTAFAIGVFLLGFNLGGWISATYEGHAGALAALDVANGAIDIGAGSKQYIENLASGGTMIGSMTMPGNSVEILEKQYAHCVYAENASVRGAKVGFTG